MKCCRSLLMLSGLWLCTSAALATAVINQDTYFQCTARDLERNVWVFNSPYERAALARALDTCKAESRAPGSCKSGKEYCDAIVNGKSTRPLWRCTAFDTLAHSWRSPIFTQGREAASAARLVCRKNSIVPETCYVNLLTCMNLNTRM